MTGKHEKCLQQLKGAEDLCEEKIKCILALHFFQPLSNGASCVVDRNTRFKKCPLCKESVEACQKETTFGHNSVWHGQCDILLQHSIVNVSIEAIEGLSFDDLGIDLDMSFCSKIVEVKTRQSIKRNQSAFQAIAQTIVNAFVVSGKDKSLFDKFIPSFLANDTTVQILLYNCKLDMLLTSGEFQFWDKDGSLCMETVINIWAALNCYVTYSDISKTLLEKTPESKFKDIVGEAYQIYLKDVCRPLDLQVKDYESKEYKLNVQPKIHGSDSQLIFDFGLKLIEQIQNC